MKQTLGEYLREARKKAHLTVRQLGNLSSMSHGYLVKVELGQITNPSAEYLVRLADILELDVSELLAFIGVEPSTTLPPPHVYFRRKYGLSDTDAKELTQIIEDYRTKQRGEGRHEKSNTDGSGAA
jgi:transcriptional regulator with XRE-family HTH domain